jgi:hypothetical protein
MTKITELKKHDVTLLLDSTTVKDIEADSKNLPSDVHVVRYVEEGVEKVDAVRAYRKTDIFDAYYDFGIKDIKEIVSGYGSIRPNLYQTNKTDKDKR